VGAFDWRNHYVARVSILLIVVALTAGMTGCFTPFRMQYQLTISSSEGGTVRSPGEGIFTYWEGTTVGLVAKAEEGYCFSGWTGNVGTVGNVTSATTKITMNCGYAIIANFEEVPAVQYQLKTNSTEGGKSFSHPPSQNVSASYSPLAGK
jgi:Divergent InlB B-repeat domain